MRYYYENRRGQRQEIARSVFLTLVTLQLVDFVIRELSFEVVRARPGCQNHASAGQNHAPACQNHASTGQNHASAGQNHASACQNHASYA